MMETMHCAFCENDGIKNEIFRFAPVVVEPDPEKGTTEFRRVMTKLQFKRGLPPPETEDEYYVFFCDKGHRNKVNLGYSFDVLVSA